MNILRHKSWHVRNRNNITRVRKDEEKAAQEERQIQRRVELADSEARINLLRHRSTKHTTREDNQTGQTSSAHLDIFEDFGDKVTTTNTEHDKEAKEEREKFEKKTGILQYLVDKEADSGQNWYLESHEKRMKLLDEDRAHSDAHKEFKDNQSKKFNDPMEDMKRYLDAMKTKDVKSVPKTKKSDITSNLLVRNAEKVHKSKSKAKKSKKHKKNKKNKRKTYSSDSSESDDNRKNEISKTIEQLRAERLEREKVERERTRALLYGNKSKNDVILDDRNRKYNSQFNPEIARQNLTD